MLDRTSSRIVVAVVTVCALALIAMGGVVSILLLRDRPGPEARPGDATTTGLEPARPAGTPEADRPEPSPSRDTRDPDTGAGRDAALVDSCFDTYTRNPDPFDGVYALGRLRQGSNADGLTRCLAGDNELTEEATAEGEPMTLWETPGHVHGVVTTYADDGSLVAVYLVLDSERFASQGPTFDV